MSENVKYPFLLSYVTKAPIWGGTRLLGDAWGKHADTPTVGESWELTVRAKEMSRIVNGPLAGKSLGDHIAENGNAVIGAGYTDKVFPLLIKLIDATDKLSVQVHPDDDYAARVENDRGKTEMWYIVEADPDAEIVYGLCDGVSAADFAAAVKAGKIGNVLKHQPVKAGEVYFIPSRLVHAIGKGILIAEIQQNCDLTYRIYDYDRRGADGKLRELHVDKALDVVRPFTEEEIDAIRFEGGKAENSDVLAHCRYFKTTLSQGNAARTFTVGQESFLYMLCLDGEGTLTGGNMNCPIKKGDSYFIPAGTGECILTGNAKVICAAIC